MIQIWPCDEHEECAGIEVFGDDSGRPALAVHLRGQYAIDELEEDCITCGGDGFEWCEDTASSEGCWEANCDGVAHTCPNCHGSGRGSDMSFM